MILEEELLEITLKEFTLSTIKHCVRFIYTGQLRVVDENEQTSELEDLSKLSERLGILTGYYRDCF